MEKKKLVILTGPTAVGKTALSIRLAKEIGGEIISADSMQVYRRMDIGSAKITKEEMQGVVHHLVDILEPTENFDVCRFSAYAKKAMEEIYDRGHIPIIVGGTGFYIQAVLYDIDFSKNEESDIRKELEQFVNEHGVHALHEMLREIDPKSAEAIHENNVKRVIRAIEYYKQTGEQISVHNEREKQKPSPYRFCYFVLNDDRQKLYERIENRIDEMIRHGLVEEVKSLLDEGLMTGMTAMQGLGYKEIAAYLNGEMSLEEAVTILKRDTRHFAKRQLTWFGREQDVIWVDKQKFAYDNDRMIDFMCEKMQEKGIFDGGTNEGIKNTVS